LSSDLVKLVEKIGGEQIPKYKKNLEVVVSADTVKDTVDAVMPTIKFNFK